MKVVARVIGAAGLALVLFVVGGLGLFHRSEKQAAPVTHVATQALSATPLVGAASLSEVIAGLQERLRALPTDWQSYANLGLAYVQQARVTADPSYYPKAQGVLARSLSLHGSDNVAALTGMAALAAARHDFSGALSWAKQAETANPDNADVQAILGDSLVELGRYDQAFHTFQRMMDLRPELSTYARVSYAWELRGSLAGALQAMDLALHAAATPTDAAWASNQIGDLYWNGGEGEGGRTWERRAHPPGTFF